MKKIIPLFALLLLAGCCALLPLGSQKDVFELVPKTANLIVIARPSVILNDSDLSSLVSKLGIESQVSSANTDSGIDFTTTDKVVFFADSNSKDPSYTGAIVRGPLDQNRIIERQSAKNIITNTTYENSVIYEAAPQEGGDSSYFTFLDSTTLIIGTKAAVEDTIDVNNGKMDSAKSNAEFSKEYDSFDKNSLLIGIATVPKSTKDYITQMAQEINSADSSLDLTSLASINYAGLSVTKKDTGLNMKMLLTAGDATTANDISDATSSILSFAKGKVQAGSATETIINKVNVAATGNTVTLTLSSTADDIKQVLDEMSPAGGSQSAQQGQNGVNYNSTG